MYETIWRNKWLTADAKSIDDMIAALEGAIEELEEIKDSGIEGDFSSASDDYIFFRTDDPKMAE